MSRIRGMMLAAIVIIAIAPFVGSYAQEPTPAASSPAAAAPAPNVPASQAIPVQQVPSPASPTHAPDQVMWALIASYTVQYLKKSAWFPFLTEASTARIKAQFGFLAAIVTAAGVHFAITGSMLDGSGATLTITGLSFDAFKDVAFQWASQQAWFDLVVHRRGPSSSSAPPHAA